MKDITGQRFGRLIVLGFGKPYFNKCNGYPSVTWKCKCDCGKEIEVSNSNLKMGHTKSCGCLALEIQRKLKCKNPEEVFWNKVVHVYSKDAIRRGYCWELTKEQAINLMKQSCFYCGINPMPNYNLYNRMKKDSKDPNIDYFDKYIISRNGIDRKDNAKGYTIDNSVTCCEFCNKSKMGYTLKEFETWIDRITEYRRKDKKCQGL